MEEDLTLKTVSDVENRQSLLYGIGDQQLDIVVSKLLARYKVDIVLSKPKFADTASTAMSRWSLNHRET